MLYANTAARRPRPQFAGAPEITGGSAFHHSFVVSCERKRPADLFFYDH
jgi:hypothetical protein